MRIAFTHAYCWPEVRRGAERFTQSLGSALVRRGHEVVILSSGWESGRSSLDGVTTVRLPRRHIDAYRHEASFGRALMRPLLLERWDVTHSLGRWDALAAITAARVRRRRTVFTDLGLPSTDWWDSQGRREAWAVRRVVRGIDVYGCMSQYALSFLASDYERANGVITPGGVAVDDFHPTARRADQPTLLFSGALDEPRKGLRDLVKALPAIAAEVPNVRLWLSGPGDPSAALAGADADTRRRIENLGLGEADEQSERYGLSWSTVLPSTHDSFGMVLVESLSCGTPITVSSHGAPKELVIEGETGSVCEPHDPSSLAAACVRSIELARTRRTVDACRSFATQFDWDVVASRCEEIYRGAPAS